MLQSATDMGGGQPTPATRSATREKASRVQRPDTIVTPHVVDVHISKGFPSHLLADGEGDVPHEQVEPGEPLDRFRGVPRALLGPILTMTVGEKRGGLRVLALCEAARGTRFLARCCRLKR